MPLNLGSNPSPRTFVRCIAATSIKIPGRHHWFNAGGPQTRSRHLGVDHIDMPLTPNRVWTAIDAAAQA